MRLTIYHMCTIDSKTDLMQSNVDVVQLGSDSSRSPESIWQWISWGIEQTDDVYVFQTGGDGGRSN
jgi:hypothetical protein